MILSAIVAYTKDDKGRQIIGKDGTIPWKIPKDMRWFQEQTMHGALIMGRKTYESIGRVLHGRDNIILTHQENYNVPKAYVFNDLEEALSFASARRHEAFIIGGEEVYSQTIDRVDRIYVTFIKDNPGYTGDTFFPSWTRENFKVIYREDFKDPVNGPVSFKIFQRVSYKRIFFVGSLENPSYNFQGHQI